MLTAHQVLEGYTQGIFPMADPDENNTIYWFEPKIRGVIDPLTFHAPKNLRRKYRQAPFELKINGDFEACIRACANRSETWISEEIIDLYCALHKMGYANSFEAWQDGQMVGGLYGVALGRIFFGESMFHTVTDASKISLMFLVEWLLANGFLMLDCQFITSHLAQFGAKTMSQKRFVSQLPKWLSSND